MAIDLIPYGKVYKHITESAKAHFGKYTLPWKYDKTKADMNKAMLKEYKVDNSYPVNLYEALSHNVLDWCKSGYEETSKDDLIDIFHELWGFHKRWLIAGETHTASEIMTQMNAEATDHISKLCSGINKNLDKRKNRITDLFCVVMEHAIEMAKEDGDGS